MQELYFECILYSWIPGIWKFYLNNYFSNFLLKKNGIICVPRITLSCKGSSQNHRIQKEAQRDRLIEIYISIDISGIFENSENRHGSFALSAVDLEYLFLVYFCFDYIIDIFYISLRCQCRLRSLTCAAHQKLQR